MSRRPDHRGPQKGSREWKKLVESKTKPQTTGRRESWEDLPAKAVRWTRYGHWSPDGSKVLNQLGNVIWSLPSTS